MEENWEKRKLDNTNLYVTSLCWGSGPLASVPENFGYEVPESQAIETLLKAFESPINFFDTSRIYGETEVLIRKAIKTRGKLPEGCIIATKADRDLETNMFSASQVRKSVEESCERLGLRVLPLVYLHDPEYDPRYRLDKKVVFDHIMAQDGPVAELEKLKKEGVISHLGISGGPIDMLLNFIRTEKFEVVITHNRWNLLWQVADPLIEEANKMGVGVVNAAPYATGILATGPKENTRAVYQIPSKEILEKVQNIVTICKEYDVPLAAAALQFSLRDRRINSTVVGVSNPEQVSGNLDLARLPIPDELWGKLESFAIREGDPEATRR